MTQNFKGIVRLSNENYLTLSTTGTLTLKDGSTLTFDPTSTLYITPDSTIDFTQEDKDKVEVIDISGDGTQFLSNDGSYKTISGVEVITGTRSNPVNCKNLEINKLYNVQGYIVGTSSQSNPTYIIDNSLFIFRLDSTSLVSFNYIYSINGFNRCLGGSSYFDINENGYMTSGGSGCAINMFNGKYGENNIMIYAPTSSGITGQVLQSNGSSAAPTWIDLPDALLQLNGTEDTPINLYNDLEVNKLYSISGVIYNSDNNLTANDSILTYKTNTNLLYLIGVKIDLLTNELSFQPNYFTIAEVEATGEISTHQSSIAPVNSGTSGQVLTSNGPDQEPTWENSSSVNIDNTTITRNNSDSIQAVGLTNGSVNLTCDNIYDALASDWEV